MSGDAKGQRARILQLFVEAKGGWVPLPEILDLKIAAYGARIWELRKLGFRIENRTESDPSTGVKKSWFRLASNPAAAETSKPKPASSRDTSGTVAVPWEQRLRATGLPLFDAGSVREGKRP